MGAGTEKGQFGLDYGGSRGSFQARNPIRYFL